jgi:exonuclease SbcC
VIESVRLEDWKSHKETELSFGTGINALVGEMGSGKSAVLEAITFALFGTLPSLQDRTISLDDLIRRSPTKADTAKVEVGFSFDGVEYTVSRIIKRDGGTKEAKLHADGDLVAGPQATEVTAAIEDILGIDYDLFASIIFAEQNELDSFLSLTPGERKETIDRLLKLDRFEDARSNLVTLRNRIKDRYSDRKADLEELKEDTEDEEIEDLRETIEDLNDEIEDLREEKETKAEDLEEITERIEDLEDLAERYETFRERQTKLEATIENMEEWLEETLPDAGSKAEAEQQKEDLEDELEKLDEQEEQLQEITTELEIARNEEQRLEEELGELQDNRDKLEDLEDIDDELDEHEKQEQELQETISEARAELDQIEDTLASLSTAADACPTCGQELTDEHRLEILQESKARKDELEGRIEETEDELEDTTETIEDLEARRDRLLSYRGIEEDIEETEQELEEARETIDEHGTAKEDLEDKIKGKDRDEIEQDLDAAEEAIEYYEIRDDIDAKREKLEKIEEELDEIAFDEEELDELNERRSELQSDIRVLRNEIETKTELLEEREKRLEDLEDQQERIEDLEEAVEKYDLLRDALGDLERSLEETQSEMRRRFVAQANDVMQTVWDRVYPYDDYSSIRLRAGDDYVLEIKDDRGDWFSVEGEVSGGERHTAALSLRIALSLVLAPGLKLLILDEPTHNLDTRAIDDLAETMRANVADLVDQLFVITHDEQLETAVTASLYHLRKKDTDHGLTEVEDASTGT